MSQRRALVTGASQGLGAEVALQLAARGFRVTLVSRRAELLQEIRGRLSGSGHEVLAADLADPNQAKNVASQLETTAYTLLINNAGASQFGAFDSLSEQRIQELIQLNFTTPALLSRAFLRSAPAGATLVNVTSIVGTVIMPGNALYSATKAALQALTECLWYEARARGVRVLDFRPVSIRTGFHASAGKPSLADQSLAAAPEQAAADLVGAIEAGRGFVYASGRMSTILQGMQRVLPARWLVKMMGRKAERAGYL